MALKHLPLEGSGVGEKVIAASSCHTTVSAPRLMSTVGTVRLITAPLTLEIKMPMSVSVFFAPVAVCICMPAVGPCTTQKTKPNLSGVCMVMPGTTGGTMC